MGKSILTVLMLLFALGCANTPDHNAERTSAGSIGDGKRQPSSFQFLLKDKYGDAMVYFCANQKSILVIDPNECGKNSAFGRGCTESANYVSRPFDFKKGGQSVILEAGRPWYQINDSGPRIMLSGKGVPQAVELAWTPMDANEFSNAKAYCP